MELVAQQLLDRFEIQASKRVYNYPFLMGQGVWLDSDKLGPNDEVREVLKHGTLSIGFIGLAETLTALYGHHHGESDEMQQKGLAIVRHMREFCDEKSRGDAHELHACWPRPPRVCPAASSRMDQKRYGKIPGVTDREYYTNSFHIPVWYPISAYDKIQKEAPYHALTNAGHISYVELDGDTANNVEAFESRRALHARRGHRLRLHQPPGRPRPRLRLCGRHRRGVPALRPPRGRGPQPGAHRRAAQTLPGDHDVLRVPLKTKKHRRVCAAKNWEESS